MTGQSSHIQQGTRAGDEHLRQMQAEQRAEATKLGLSVPAWKDKEAQRLGISAVAVEKTLAAKRFKK
jgi:hypothetical protein